MNKPARILVVEDDPGLRFAFTRSLQAAGYLTLEAATGAEGLRLARQEVPDLILLDIVLPDINGAAVCQEIKADPKLARILVIELSGVQTSAESQSQALEAGADGYLTKPIELRMLLAQVRAFLRIKFAEAALVTQQERELDSLTQLSQAGVTPATAQLLGAAPLRESAPARFQQLLDRYGQMLELTLEQQAYKVEHDLTTSLRALAEELGFLRARPRDIIDLHTTTLKRKISDPSLPKAQAYLEAGRLRVLELMGYLASYYRNHAIGVGKPVLNPSDNLPPKEPTP